LANVPAPGKPRTKLAVVTSLSKPVSLTRPCHNAATGSRTWSIKGVSLHEKAASILSIVSGDEIRSGFSRRTLDACDGAELKRKLATEGSKLEGSAGENFQLVRSNSQLELCVTATCDLGASAPAFWPNANGVSKENRPKIATWATESVNLDNE